MRLAERAACELASAARVHLHDLVAPLRDYVQEALDLDPVPTGLAIPRQGPTHPVSAGGRSKGGREDGAWQGGSGGASRMSGGGGMVGGRTGMSLALDEPDELGTWGCRS